MPCCPYGPVVVLPGIIAFFAWVLTWAFGFGCHMIDVPISTSHSLGVGPWTAQSFDYAGTSFDDAYGGTIYYYNVCILYGSWVAGGQLQPPNDSYFKTARAFSMMAIALSIPLFIIVMIPCCCSLGDKAKNIYKFTAFACVFTSFASLMTLIIKNSSTCGDGCSYGSTAWICIVTGILWFFTGLAFCAMPSDVKEASGSSLPPPAAYPESPGMATTGLDPVKEITRTNNADGTVTVTTKMIVTNPDGSKTVTETTDIEKA